MSVPSSQISIGDITLTLPTNWESSIEDGVLCIFQSDNGAGAIQVSSFSLDKNTPFNLFDEFHQLATETITVPLEKDWAKNIKQIHNHFLVLDVEIPAENKFFTMGLCKYNSDVLFLTYNCSLEDKGIEYKTVQAFFENIKFK